MPLVRRRPLAGFATLGAVALIAGCGGGSSSLTADEFRSQADAICADYNTQSDALADPTSAAEYLPALKKILPLQTAELTKLKALKPPSDLKGAFDEALALLDKQSAALTTATTRIEGGEDPETVITDIGAQAGAIGDQADAKAKQLGLKVCGTNGSGSSTTSTTATAPPPVTTAPATDTTATTTTDSAGYVADVQAAATALQSFGTVLSSSTGLEDLKAKIPSAQKSLDNFDVAIAKLDGYTLGIPNLDTQRAGLARTGPKVSDVLRRFLDAVGSGDLVAVQKLIPEVTTTITEFQKAATG
jgi:hypothetical protein